LWVKSTRCTNSCDRHACRLLSNEFARMGVFNILAKMDNSADWHTTRHLPPVSTFNTGMQTSFITPVWRRLQNSTYLAPLTTLPLRRAEPHPHIPNCTAAHPEVKTEPQLPLPNTTTANNLTPHHTLRSGGCTQNSNCSGAAAGQRWSLSLRYQTRRRHGQRWSLSLRLGCSLDTCPQTTDGASY
jgi:hypothetical protein